LTLLLIGSRTHGTPTHLIDNEHQTHLENILPTLKTFAITKKDYQLTKTLAKRNCRLSEQTILQKKKLHQKSCMKPDKNFANKKEIDLATVSSPSLTLPTKLT